MCNNEDDTGVRLLTAEILACGRFGVASKETRLLTFNQTKNHERAGMSGTSETDRSKKSKRLSMDSPNKGGFQYDLNGKPRNIHRTWFRGEHCNYGPDLEDMKGLDAVTKHVLHGWAPKAPVISEETNVVAFGSCFAENITNWLSKRNFNVLTDKDGEFGDTYVVRFGEGMVNTFVIRQQFEWAFENKVFDEELWHGYDAAAFGYDEEIRLRTREVFMKADFFIITLGLSEVWCDKDSGGVFWRAVPQDKYDPERHVFRVSSHAENLENINAIYKLIRKHRPDADIMFTLSPIPLAATFRPVSCISANSVSKAILRSALDEFLQQHQPDDSGLHYWPSYEIVTDVFGNRWRPDRRHIKPQILDFIMTTFEHVWCKGAPSAGLAEAWVKARCVVGDLPPRLYKFLLNGNLENFEKILQKLPAADVEIARQAQAEMNERINRRAEQADSENA